MDHSPCSRYVRRFFVYFSGSGTYRPPQDAGLRRRPAYHRLKLVLAWSVPLLTSVGIKLCELFCNRVVPRDVSGELALCCCLSCGLLYLVLMLWVNVKLNALAEACPAKGAE